jgi:hypothetical protein
MIKCITLENFFSFKDAPHLIMCLNPNDLHNDFIDFKNLIDYIKSNGII